MKWFDTERQAINKLKKMKGKTKKNWVVQGNALVKIKRL